MNETGWANEVKRGERFPFGANWASFLRTLDEDRIRQAEESLVALINTRDLRGKRFLDIGSGSGLFSLAAYRLGADVHSFDYDPDSVRCTAELRRRYGNDGDRWTVEEGSVLDPSYMEHLGMFDVVYSWGVLHATGRMWEALAAAADRVTREGLLAIAIYNDQGRMSRAWKTLKRTYNRVPGPLKLGMILPAAMIFWGPVIARDALLGNPAGTWRNYKSVRGMSAWHDLVDWVGGYPFEVARPEEILRFYRARGFELVDLTTRGGGIGCNEYVFRRRA